MELARTQDTFADKPLLHFPNSDSQPLYALAFELLNGLHRSHEARGRAPRITASLQSTSALV